MGDKRKKTSLKKLKSRLIAKLFGQPSKQPIEDGPDRSQTCSSTPESFLSGEASHNANDRFHRVGSSSNLSDDEGSGSDRISSKRRKRHVSSESRKQAQQLASPSSSSSIQDVHCSRQKNNPTVMTSTSSIKMRKRKCRKNPKDADKTTESTLYTEFSSESKQKDAIQEKNDQWFETFK